jgi:hypothetical protein
MARATTIADFAPPIPNAAGAGMISVTIDDLAQTRRQQRRIWLRPVFRLNIINGEELVRLH